MTTPISATSMPNTSAADQSRMELQAKLNGLGGINGRQVAPEVKAQKLREACEGFESIFIQKMWQEMRNAVPKTNLLTGREERFWQDMYDQELSKSMTKAGGIGLADMMYEQLSRNLVSASRTAADGAAGAAFTPTAAPLVPEQDLQDQIAPPKPAPIYETAAPQAVAAGPESDGQPAAAKTERPEPIQTAEDQSNSRTAAIQPTAKQAAEAAAIYGAAAQASQESNRPRRGVTHVNKGKIHAADLGQSSGLINAQKARRDAGDKIGARAVRPAQNRAARRAAEEQQPEAPVQTAGIMQNGNLLPGSPDALKAAVEMAKSGNVNATANNGQPQNLAALVANVQAKNAAAEQLLAQAANQPAEPVTRKVRRTSNIPQRSSNNARPKAQKPSQVIRTLNVDNVGVNSKAGQGLKAYQAQKEAQQAYEQAANAAQPAAESVSQPIAPLTASQQSASAAIPPLTAKDSGTMEQDTGNFAIPPLTAAQARSHS